MKTSQHFLGDVFSENHDWPTWTVLTLWGALGAAAWIAKSRVLRFAWLFLLIAPLPIAFIPPRTPAQYYIPWFGWTLYAGTLLVGSLTYLSRRIPTTPLRVARIRGTATVVGLAVLLFTYFEHKGWANAGSITHDALVIRSTAEQLHRIYPQFRLGSRLYFMNDPFGPTYDLLFIMRLSYHDRTLVVDRSKQLQRAPDQALLASYDHVFDYRAGQFYELTRPWVPPSLPTIVQLLDGSEAYHEDFKPVTPDSPAAVGELIITKVIDLGPTNPAVAQGQVFPQDPLLPVASPVEVRVDGLKAEVMTKLGWPDFVNAYRLDFRIPPGVKHGNASVEIQVNSIKGPRSVIPVR